MSYYLAYALSAALLVAAAAYVGVSHKHGVLGILIDSRGRYSLNHMQVVMWTILVLSSFMALFVLTWEIPEIPETLLVLMGISGGTAVTAGAVKGAKDTNPNVMIARVAPLPAHFANLETVPTAGATVAQMYLEEEGIQAETTVSPTKFQNFVFTIVLGITYLTLTLQTAGFPVFNDTALWLIGISHAGYVAGKIPNKV